MGGVSRFMTSDTCKRISIAVLPFGEGCGDIQERVERGGIHHIHREYHPSLPALFSFLLDVCLFDGERSEVNESVFRLRQMGEIQETSTMMDLLYHVIGVGHRMPVDSVRLVIDVMNVENHSPRIPMRLGKEERLTIQMPVLSTKTSIANIIGK
jgi:hypothetical protein